MESQYEIEEESKSANNAGEQESRSKFKSNRYTASDLGQLKGEPRFQIKTTRDIERLKEMLATEAAADFNTNIL